MEAFRNYFMLTLTRHPRKEKLNDKQIAVSTSIKSKTVNKISDSWNQLESFVGDCNNTD